MKLVQLHSFGDIDLSVKVISSRVLFRDSDDHLLHVGVEAFISVTVQYLVDALTLCVRFL